MRRAARIGTETLLAGVLLALFALVAGLVIAGVTRGFDHTVLARLREAADPGVASVSPGTVRRAIELTALGGGWARIGLAVIACALLLGCRRGRDAALLAGATATGIVAMALVKDVVGRARPDLAWRLITVDHASFPSGHAMGSMITYPLIGFALGHAIGGRWSRRLCVTIGIAVALLVGATRVLLGVHWASDVIGGWLLGGAWALGAVALRERA